MIQEPYTIRFIRIIIELIWTLLKMHFFLIRAIVRFIVPPEPKDVTGEIVFITGTGHGMGREVALRFAKLGATVVCVDVNEIWNEETVQMIRKQKGEAVGFKCDVTDRAAVFKLAEKISEDIGDVTILINNAGIMPCKPILKHSEKEIRAIMEINVNANLWMIQAFLPAMIKQNYGHIVSMSSMAGIMGITNLVPYSASKFAVRGIMTALAMELHDDPRATNGIKLTTVCPSMVDTGLCKKPHLRFPSLIKMVTVEEAADAIVDAVRKEYMEISIPGYLHYISRYVFSLMPFAAAKVMDDFIKVGLDPDDS